jgi:caffeoyl-CoA O-methyltransferase
MSAKYLPLNDALYAYVVANRSNAQDPVLDALRAETESLGEISKMAISPEQGSLLNLLAGLVGAKWAVEIGTFTGISSINLARALAPGGKLYCFDQDYKWTSMARRYWIKAGVNDRIELRLGDAHRMFTHFRPQGPLDFVFIDADKESYDAYYEFMLPLVRPGGIILFDNMLRGGQVIHPTDKNLPETRAIDQLNRKLAADPRIQAVLLPVADGVYLCRKRAGVRPR